MSPIKLFDLEFECDHYYIKRSRVVEQIQFDNRTFYAKFERIDEPPSPLLLQQHLDKHYTIALPLLKNGATQYLVIEYKGDEYRRFYHLVKHLFTTLDITDYSIYQGKDEERIQVFVKVPSISLKEADARLESLSDALRQKMTKKWKCLPSSSLPEAYNIVTLPYKKL